MFEIDHEMEKRFSEAITWVKRFTKGGVTKFEKEQETARREKDKKKKKEAEEKAARQQVQGGDENDDDEEGSVSLDL